MLRQSHSHIRSNSPSIQSRQSPLVRLALLSAFLIWLLPLDRPVLKEAHGASFKKLQPLEYTVLDITLESSPAAIARNLKAKDYLRTKTRRKDGLEITSFTAEKRHRLYKEVYLAACQESGQSVGLYVVGYDGAAMLELAQQRYGLTGLDLERPLGEHSISGPMRTGRSYRKHYPNVSISFYGNKGFGSFTLAFESPEALAACRRQQKDAIRQEDMLRRQIEAESNERRCVD